MRMDQLSLFDVPTASATCLWEYDRDPRAVESPSSHMKRLVQDGKYVVYVGGRPLVLRLTGLKPEEVPEGHHFYHYLVGGRVYSGIFVGVEEVA